MVFKKVKLDKVEKLVRRSRPEALSHRGWRMEEELGTNTKKTKEWLLQKSKEEGKCRAYTIFEAN